MQVLELPDRPIAMELAGILRLANALDTRHGVNENENAPRLEVGLQDRYILVRASGYSALDRSAECIAAARHLLETVLRRPVIVRPLLRTSRSSAAGSISATLPSKVLQ
jgi:hypothetical protein